MEFGLFAAAYGFAIAFQSFCDFGMTQYIVQLRVADRDDVRIGAALRLGTRVSGVGILFGCLCLGALAFFHPELWSLFLIPVWIMSEKQVEAWLAIALADGKLWQNAFSLVLRRLGALLVLVVAHQAGWSPVPSYVAGLAIFSLIAWIIVSRVARDVRLDCSFSRRALLRGGRHYWTNSLSLQAMNLDVSLVAWVSTPQMAGYYGAASRLTTPLRIVPTSFATVLFPAAARKSVGQGKDLLRPVIVLIGLTTVLYVGLALLLPVVVPLILGPAYEPATEVIRVVCLGLVFAAITSQLRSLMQGWGYLRAVTWISSTTTVLSLISIGVCAWLYGALGAGTALALNYVFQLAIQAVTMLSLTRRRNR